jgi:hypothetical protein
MKSVATVRIMNIVDDVLLREIHVKIARHSRGAHSFALWFVNGWIDFRFGEMTVTVMQMVWNSSRDLK